MGRREATDWDLGTGNLRMARQGMAAFMEKRQPKWIPADLPC